MEEYKLRPYMPFDAQAAVDLINTSSLQTVGFRRAVVDSRGNIWAHHFVPFSSKKVVAIDQNNEIAGYAYFTSGDNFIVAETGISIHPGLMGQGIDARLLAWAEAQAKDSLLKAPPGIRTVLQTNLYETERNAVEFFKRHGYSPVREWAHLVLEMNSPPTIPALTPGLILRQMDLDNDWDIVGPAMDEAYADHWGAIAPEALEVGSEVNETREGEDEPEDSSYSNSPGYCFVVLDQGVVAGGILCNAKLVDRADTGRVGSMFVRPRYRRQGIARALMLAAFDAFWQNGFRRIITDTDAKSFTDAPKLYQGLGMKLYRREYTYEKEIRPGKEVRLLR